MDRFLAMHRVPGSHPVATEKLRYWVRKTLGMETGLFFRHSVAIAVEGLYHEPYQALPTYR